MKHENGITVYRRKSTYGTANNPVYWYSATRSDGVSLTIAFKNTIPVDFANEPVFVIYNVKGSAKKKDVVKDGVTYHNVKYYVTSCDFDEIEGEDLEF